MITHLNGRSPHSVDAKLRVRNFRFMDQFEFVVTHLLPNIQKEFTPGQIIHELPANDIAIMADIVVLSEKDPQYMVALSYFTVQKGSPIVSYFFTFFRP